MLRLRVLGSFVLAGESGVKSLPPHRLALLAILATAGETGIARDKLLAYLWPESTPAKARASLEQMLHTLRGQLEAPSALRGNPLLLDSEVVTSDVSDFRAALADGDLERAVELYAGPLLDGFYLSGLPEFEEWVESERRALVERYASALERLAKEAVGHGDHGRAAKHLRALGAVNPLSGRVTQQLMEALAALGDRDAALQVAAQYAARVREQLSVEPEPNVTALAAKLRTLERATADQNDALPLAPTPPPKELVTVTQVEIQRPRAPFPDESTRRARRSPLIVLGTAALALLALASWFALRPSKLDPKRVLVGGFDDRTGDAALGPFVRHTTADIVSGLASTGIVQPFDASSLAATGTAPSEYQNLKSLARRIKAGSVVSGTALRRGDSVEFQIKLTDVATGTLLRPVNSVVRPAMEARGAVALVAQRVLAAYAANADPRFRHHAVVSQPNTYDALREFQAGVQMRKESPWFDAPRTALMLEHFQRAIALDSSFMAPRIWVAQVQAFVGGCRVTDSIATRLRALGTQLLAADQAGLDYAVSFCSRDARGVYEAARALLKYQPEVAENVATFADAANAFNRPRESLQCLEQLEATDAPDRFWRADCWNTLLHAYHSLGQYHDALRMIERMKKEAPDDELIGRHPLLERYQMRQWAALGDVSRINELMEERIRRSSQEVKAGEDMLSIGEELRGHGHVDAGRLLCERGVKWYAALPSVQQVNRDSRLYVAMLLYCAEQWNEARVAYERLAAEDSSERGAMDLSVVHGGGFALQTRLAALAARGGDTGAVARVDHWLAANDSSPRASYGRAVIAGFRGDRERALGFFRFAWERGTPSFTEAHSDPALEPLRDYKPVRDLIYSVR